MPWIVRFTFQDKECLDIQAYDLFKNQDEKKEAGMMKNRLSQRLPLLGIAPVSYTHLDVYKRQAVYPGVFAGAGPADNFAHH